ncbi:HlyD family type I secretion periplasmic adaptor subunit [Desulfovibrio sp. OttesenSCG-928-G15]|nr:HlyD family type I secretion periplasmic adaptor subunit [Desulfovibrio sp. OttesenSCG-928-G15]
MGKPENGASVPFASSGQAVPDGADPPAAVVAQAVSTASASEFSVPEASAERFAEYMQPLAAAHLRRGKHSSRLLLYALCLTFFLLTLWAAFADIEETVVGSGQVMTSQKVQHIQNLEGGILREVLVHEGQAVDKGDILLRIDNEQAGSVYRDSMQKSRELTATLARLDAEISGQEAVFPAVLLESDPDLVARHSALLDARRKKTETEIKGLESQLELKRQEEKELIARKKSLGESLGLAARQRDVAKKLMEARSYSQMEYLNLARQVAQIRGDLDVLDSSIPKTRAAIREAEERLALHASDREMRLLQERNEATAELATLNEILIAGADRVTRTEVRSPVRGIIKSVHITTEGGVILPGEVIMDVVPSDEPLIIEARISPQDIAFLFVGQKARIRLTAYDFAIYGALDATLEYLSADAIEGRQGEIYYKAGLKTDASHLVHNGQVLPILPGMMATADIITGKRTVLDYVIKPILKAKQSALRER